MVGVVLDEEDLVLQAQVGDGLDEDLVARALGGDEVFEGAALRGGELQVPGVQVQAAPVEEEAAVPGHLPPLPRGGLDQAEAAPGEDAVLDPDGRLGRALPGGPGAGVLGLGSEQGAVHWRDLLSAGLRRGVGDLADDALDLLVDVRLVLLVRLSRGRGPGGSAPPRGPRPASSAPPGRPTRCAKVWSIRWTARVGKRGVRLGRHGYAFPPFMAVKSDSRSGASRTSCSTRSHQRPGDLVQLQAHLAPVAAERHRIPF